MDTNELKNSVYSLNSTVNPALGRIQELGSQISSNIVSMQTLKQKGQECYARARQAEDPSTANQYIDLYNQCVREYGRLHDQTGQLQAEKESLQSSTRSYASSYENLAAEASENCNQLRAAMQKLGGINSQYGSAARNLGSQFQTKISVNQACYNECKRMVGLINQLCGEGGSQQVKSYGRR